MDDNKLSMLTSYVARGWALVPLHDVTGGTCSCPAASLCKSAGKHPRYRDWPASHNLVRDAATLATLHHEHPGWNWGIATGPASGIWVLDVDVRGFAAFAALCASLGQSDVFGTYGVTTASGGLHWYFTLPPDFTPTNSRGRLPVGVDVRGAGGQVVAPPSVALAGGKLGDYLPIDDRPVGPAPAWLLDLIRPVQSEPHSATAVGVESPIGTTGRGPAYAAAAVRACVDELRATPAGDRNNAAYRSAVRLIELVNAAWSGLIVDDVFGAWYGAGKAHPDGEHVPDAELQRVWDSAARHVGSRPADPPAEQDWMGGVMLPLSAPLTDGRSTGPPSGGAQFLVPDAGSPSVAQVDPFEHAVSVELGRLAVREEARRRHAATVGGTATDRMERMRERAMSTKELKARPVAPMLIPKLLVRNSLARVVGAPATGKSFVVLDIMASLAGGLGWADAPAGEPRRVLAMIAEGLDGTAVRIAAWERAREVEIDDEALIWYPEAVQTADAAAWDAFLLFAAQVQPELIVIDTQARVTVGANENDAGEMGLLVDSMERLRAATGACVLLVHHTPLVAERARGNNAVLGAMTTELLVRRDGKIIELSILKQKDGSEDPVWQFELRPVPVADGAFLLPRTDDPVAPFWLDPATSGASSRRRPVLPSAEQLTGFLAKAAGAIAEIHGTPAATATKAEIRKTLEQYGAFGSDATFKRTWASLLERRIIGQIRGTQQYRHVPVGERDALTDPRLGEPDGAAGFYVG